MKELIKIETREDGRRAVSARALYISLGFKKEDGNFSRWIKQQLESIDATENYDYSRLVFKDGANNADVTDYVLNLDTAKEICMVVGVSPRTNKETRELSKNVRKYFIECEKKLKHLTPSYSIDDPIARAEAWIQEQKEKQALQLENKQQQQIIGELQPKATYYDLVLQSTGLTPISLIAKDYGMSAVTLNKRLHEFGVQYKQSDTWLLYAKYQDKGYTQSKTQTYQKGDGTTGTRLHTQWTQKGRLFLYDILKQNNILPVIEREG